MGHLAGATRKDGRNTGPLLAAKLLDQLGELRVLARAPARWRSQGGNKKMRLSQTKVIGARGRSARHGPLIDSDGAIVRHCWMGRSVRPSSDATTSSHLAGSTEEAGIRGRVVHPRLGGEANGGSDSASSSGV